ncbi:hypothetical protein [Actinomadura sp. HBU206391]|uniref:hypothetical protein n=1 Tax=Actinomadura sp. HBU206391 TaxID=2731692 RepID=UPI00164F5802|nr:hypothetical protein [Actinomadura sp. HBU206391]MBC6462449.1 hypothetical protein [Actinomadura sp. HBU206391]
MEPIQALETSLSYLTECLVIAYELSSRRGAFTLVVDYPMRSPGSMREFAAFVFDDARVERLHRDGRTSERLHGECRSTWGGAVIQTVRQFTQYGRGRVELWYSLDAGIQVTYGTLRGFTRASTAQQVGGSWVYRDLRSGEEFDFDHPFPSLMEPPRP